MDIEKTIHNLKKNGFIPTYHERMEDALSYLSGKIKKKTVGLGGSVTLQTMGVYEELAKNNEVHWHWTSEGKDAVPASVLTDVYITSANALSEDGEVVNIDGSGNRVASTTYGHKELYIVCGVQKITPDLASAIHRARNIAAPANAKRLNRKTPCATKEEAKCYDCNSPDRICRALTVLWKKPSSFETVEVILIGEPVGY
jgi:hypothetical protein